MEMARSLMNYFKSPIYQPTIYLINLLYIDKQVAFYVDYIIHDIFLYTAVHLKN